MRDFEKILIEAGSIVCLIGIVTLLVFILGILIKLI